MRMAAYFPLTLSNTWHSHICYSLCRDMIAEDLEISLVAPTIWRAASQPFVRPGVPWPLNPLTMRVDRFVPVSARLGERRYQRELLRADAAYLWAGVPLSMYRKVRERGIPLIVERINNHRKTARGLLHEAYDRVGFQAPASYTEAAIAEENEKLELADFVFAPSPGVRSSLRDAGVPEHKILRSSYGFCPSRIPLRRKRPLGAPFTALFVGMQCIRKGVHVALEAWARAAIPGGKLILCGEVEDYVPALCQRWWDLPSIHHQGYDLDVGNVYTQADVLVLPSVEEGSPLVVYEAMAAGVVPIVSPMAAGEVVRDGVEGRVLDAYAVDHIADALCRFAEHPDELAAMRERALSRARDFMWSRVAQRRREQLLCALRAA